MDRSLTVCCDANLVVRAVTGAAGVSTAPLWERWRNDGQTIVAPTLLRYEVTNALHRLVRGGLLDPVDAAEAIDVAVAFPIALHGDDDLHSRAMDLAIRLKLPAAYDAHYLALAERLGIEFWTGDERLYNSVRHQLFWVHLAGSSS